MPANGLPFDFNSSGKGSNTRIDYLFRDGDITVRDSIVLEGKMAPEDVADIGSSLPGGKRFLPNKVGLPDLLSKMPSSWKEQGDGYHEIERISYTTHAEDDFAPTADQFAAMAGNVDFPTEWNTEAARL